MPVKNDQEEIIRACRTIARRGGVVEVRLPAVLRGKGTVAGYFDADNFDKIPAAVAKYAHAEGVYITVNEVHPGLIARYNNRLAEYAEKTSNDDDIVRRLWLPIDCDPKRPAKISSSDEEHRASHSVAGSIFKFLVQEMGWPSAAFLAADSGNGGHLLVAIDEPNDKETVTLITRCLMALGKRFDTDYPFKVEVDQTTFNASRIFKMYGTVARKGDDTPERPHRLSSLLRVPPEVAVVSREMLCDLASLLPEEPQRPQATGRPGPLNSAEDKLAWLENWLQRHGITTDRAESYQSGYRLRCDCIFNADHKKPDAIFSVGPNGIGFKCSHNSCRGYDWAQVREKFEPGWKDAQEQKRREKQNAQNESRPGGDDESAEEKKSSAAKRLLEMGRENCELWHSPDQSAYVTLRQGNRETMKIASTPFRDLLRQWFYDESEKVVAPAAMQSAIEQLESEARIKGKQYPVYCRKAHIGDTIYIDLCDDKYRIIKVDANGWELARDCPARFRRSKSMRPLPVPEKGGNIADIRKYINAPLSDTGEDALFPLLVAWCLAALGPHQPYPILNLTGEQGSAKTFTARILRSLIDPADPDLRREPKDERDLAIAATNNHLVALDNLSGLPAWLSDAFCCLSTGGGFGTRKNYSDDEESLFSNQNPLLLTGIGEASARGDFLERSIVVPLPTIREGSRRTEREIKDAFDKASPKLFGALLTAVSVGLRNLPNTRLDKLPRMADFMLWVTACEPACPWNAGLFQTLYAGNQENASASVLDANPITEPVQKFINSNKGGWTGTATELLDALMLHCTEDQKRRMPTTAKVLSEKLNRIAPALRKAGYGITNRRTKHGSEWALGEMGGLFDDAPVTHGDAPGEKVTHGDAPVRHPSASEESAKNEKVTQVTQKPALSTLSVEFQGKVEEEDKNRDKEGEKYIVADSASSASLRHPRENEPENTPNNSPAVDPRKVALETLIKQTAADCEAGKVPAKLDPSEAVVLPGGITTANPAATFASAWSDAESFKKSNPDGWGLTEGGKRVTQTMIAIARWWEKRKEQA